MANPELLIADFFGSFSPGCSSAPVTGQIWLRRHGDLLIVYWEAQASMIDRDGEFMLNQDYFVRGGYVARNAGPTRWQTLAIVPPDRRTPELADLTDAFADQQQWEKLLQAGLSAAMGEMYVPLRRCIFKLYSHQWHALMEGGNL